MNPFCTRWILFSAIFLSLMFVFSPSMAQDPLRVGFVYTGPVSDHGWTFAHDQGRKYLEKKLGDRVETNFVESVSVSEAPQVFTRLSRQDYDVIFGTTFGFMDPMLKVAKKYPRVLFEHCSGFKTNSNMATYIARMYQARYLSGVVAGYKTESNLIGFVAAHPIPLVLQDINAFALGVKSVNPKAKVRVVWSNTWEDPAKEKEAALSLLEAGADVMAQYQDTPAPLQAAAENGAWGIGFHTDMKQFAPDSYLTSPVWNWGPYYVKTVRNILEGEWEPHQYWGGLKDGVVGLAPLSEHVSAEARGAVERAKRKIIQGEKEVFQGPISDQDGNRMVSPGESLSDQEIQSMNWFVSNVQGSIPK